ncbi:MAG: Phosphoribosylformylglycinamidine cyclo-ligase [Candidatus Adlerbacteria bacterium GW2011_GWA1_54_10]|uniref:Phosphoribosylformylglycinamidine cyclo-ligase n=3 Tax=Candidatus Adleribacteriota TaxID=1752736 RepID=A0A0G1XY31_9BACT|nr:MAG: Phosphoribosylformylglycinamidine cyclo-ligase [Candidatus Adlerbacteria bacterium GW2011_GWA1_54_10]KKW37948.1 MAG: Phosphoribosylformylglycinamidine cyclo-ligase [Candidatus Adlerbacteria bacterium GW2011_GWB1_54_7]
MGCARRSSLRRAKTGRSIPAVRVHGVDVDRVRFPAARQNMYNPIKPYKYKILRAIERTWKTPHIEVHRGVYPTFKKKFRYPEVDHTDGIGTKGFYHWRAGTFKSAVLDALAMNLNDLALVRATPYKLSNHITVPVEDERIFKIIQAVVAECRNRKIAVVGGENSFHNNLEGLDISMTVSGFVKKPQPNEFKDGDVLVGLKSSGLHSNGMTTVRRIFGKARRPEFTVPTKIYLDNLLKFMEKHTVHGMMHITGGAFAKLKDILGSNNAIIRPQRKLMPQKIFFDLYKRGISSREMYTTFNCGIGFVLSVPQNEGKAALQELPGAAIVGEVVHGHGRVKIMSAFDGKVLML